MTRLAAALNSSDLSHEETFCDVDVLQAAGLSSSSYPLGVLILEARESCAGESSHSVARIIDLQIALQGKIKRLARRWNIKVDISGVAEKVASELILDRCIVCHGRGVIPMKYDGSRLVEVEEEGKSKDVACSDCLGSGRARRDYQARAKSAGVEYSKRLNEWWDAVHQSCSDAEIDARNSMRSKLK